MQKMTNNTTKKIRDWKFSSLVMDVDDDDGEWREKKPVETDRNSHKTFAFSCATSALRCNESRLAIDFFLDRSLSSSAAYTNTLSTLPFSHHLL